jgi:hypothetical protein
MGRFDPTGQVRDPNVEHSVVELPWGIMRGALGPSDGSAGALSNVPSALAVLRHAAIYRELPAEIEDAFRVLEQHAIDDGQLFPVAVTVVPFLFDIVRRGAVVSAVSTRITDVLAMYAAAARTLEWPLQTRCIDVIGTHALEVAGWIGRFDRAVAALAIHVPAVRADVVTVLAEQPRVAPELLLALVEIGAAPGRTKDLAVAMLTGPDATEHARMCAAAFLGRHADASPELRTKIDAALPPNAAEALERFVRALWRPTIHRPVVAPKMYDAEVVFAGEKLVLVRAGVRSIALPWTGPPVRRGEVIKVGITAHWQPKIAIVTDASGSVRVLDF